MKRETAARLLSLVLALTMLMGICLLTGCSSSDEEVAYSGSVKEYDDVYVDLISIEPMTKIGSSYTNGIITNYTETACVCYTSSGAEVWVYIDIDEYLEQFDATADFEGDNWWADRVDFSSPVRVHGEMRDAEDMCEGLSYDIGTSLVLVFESRE